VDEVFRILLEMLPRDPHKENAGMKMNESFQWVRHTHTVVGLRLGGPEARLKRGPSDDVITLSQP